MQERKNLGAGFAHEADAGLNIAAADPTGSAAVARPEDGAPLYSAHGPTPGRRVADRARLDGGRLRFWNIGMGKYDALGVFLRRWKFRNDADGVELSFTQIESIIRGLLPRGAGDEAWWCVNCHADRSAPHRRVWLDAGFDAIAEPKTEKVYFRRRCDAA